MRLRPALPAAGAALCLIAALSAPAFASLDQAVPSPDAPSSEAPSSGVPDVPVPGKGDVTTALTLLDLTGAGHAVSLAKIDLLSTLLESAPLAKIGLTPLVADGKAYGTQETTDGPGSTAALGTSAVPGLPAGLFSATAPALSGTATTTDGSAKSLVGSDSLGGLSLLGLPVD